MRVLHLVRENGLDWLRSMHCLGAPSKIPGQRRPDRLRVDATRLVAKLRSKAAHDVAAASALKLAAARAGSPYLRLAYEDLCGQPLAFRRVFEFLSIAADDATLEQVRRRGEARSSRARR